MKNSLVIMPKGKKILMRLGENIKLARLRRKLGAEQVAERAGISRATLWQIEKGTHTVAMGAYFQVLFVLGLESDFLKLAEDDQFGRKIQDAGLIPKSRAPKNIVHQKDNKKDKGTANEGPLNEFYE